MVGIHVVHDDGVLKVVFVEPLVGVRLLGPNRAEGCSKALGKLGLATACRAKDEVAAGRIEIDRIRAVLHVNVLQVAKLSDIDSRGHLVDGLVIASFGEIRDLTPCISRTLSLLLRFGRSTSSLMPIAILLTILDGLGRGAILVERRPIEGPLLVLSIGTGGVGKVDVPLEMIGA